MQLEAVWRDVLFWSRGGLSFEFGGLGKKHEERGWVEGRREVEEG
jgi:hypothetical protein